MLGGNFAIILSDSLETIVYEQCIIAREEALYTRGSDRGLHVCAKVRDYELVEHFQSHCYLDSRERPSRNMRTWALFSDLWLRTLDVNLRGSTTSETSRQSKT